MPEPKFIVCDINDVLLHRFYDPHQQIYHKLKSIAEYKLSQRPIQYIAPYCVVFRPFMDDFIHAMFENNRQVIVYSSMKKENLDNLVHIVFDHHHHVPLDVLDRTYTIKDPNGLEEWKTIKDLNIIWNKHTNWNPKQTIAFDNTASKLQLQPGNLALVPTYECNLQNIKSIFWDKGLLGPIAWLRSYSNQNHINKFDTPNDELNNKQGINNQDEPNCQVIDMDLSDDPITIETIVDTNNKQQQQKHQKQINVQSSYVLSDSDTVLISIDQRSSTESINQKKVKVYKKRDWKTELKWATDGPYSRTRSHYNNVNNKF